MIAGMVHVRRLAVVVVGIALALAAACGGEGGGEAGGGAGNPERGSGRGSGVDEPELREELLAMQEADQAERTGAATASRDDERTERLGEILDEYGWPGRDLVGEDGSTAAWVIAQHSDLDVEFQERALDLLRAAVDEGQASPGDLAYLTDRVAANRGEPQVYGTQIGCVDGEPQVGELQDPETVDERRAEAGLGPLEEYLAELRPACQEEAEAQAGGA